MVDILTDGVVNRIDRLGRSRGAMSESSDRGDVRDLVRRAILDVLREEASQQGRSAFYEQEIPAQRELTVVVRGSERAIGLLEAALDNGEEMLEVAIGKSHGPKARVMGRLA